MLKERPPTQSRSPRHALNARVLGRLLAMQSVVGSLPDEKSIFSFVCRGLLDFPGVAEASYATSSSETIGSSLRRFPIINGNCDVGELLVKVSDPAAFAPYESYLENFSAMVAVILEERRQRCLNELHQIELERRVQDRTADLARTNAALRVEVAERLLQKDEKQTILSTTIDGFYLVDKDGRILDTNDAYCRMIGYSREELLKMAIKDFEMIDSDEVIKKRIQQIKENGHVRFETRHRRKDGRIIDIEASCSFLKDEKKRLFVFMRDITDRKQAEAALRESEERHRTILQTAMDAFCRLDLQGRLLEVNDAYCRMSGYDKQELLAMDISALEAAETPADTAAHFQNIRARSEDRFETRHRRKDGSCFPVEVSVQYKPGEGGQLVAFIRDLTEQKRAESELTRHREHLEELVAARTADLQAANRELEAFSYSVSHDLRAPLRAIDGYTHVLLEDYAQPLGQEGQRMLGVICHQTGLMSQLIDDLLTFSRMGRQAMQTADIDMDALAQDAFREQSALNPNRAVECKIGPLPPALGDRSMIRVVLNNLLSNAIKYTRGRTPPLIEIGGTAQGAQNIYFVKDNGVGFDMKYAGKLFGVFQRLHAATEFEGTGVGLALADRIIHRHGGRVWAEGKVNEGATFYFSLPVHMPSI